MESMRKALIILSVSILTMAHPVGASQEDVLDNLMTKVGDEWIRHHPALIIPWNQFEATLAEVLIDVGEITGTPRYKKYAMKYMNNWIDKNGNLRYPVDETDEVYPGVLALWAYEQTGDERYLRAAIQCKDWLFEKCPRLSNGAFPHLELGDDWGPGILAVETATMVSYFLAYLGKVTGDEQYFDEAASQLIALSDYLQDAETGLFYQAWAEGGAYRWAEPETHRSTVLWGRGMGWYLYGLINTLELLPQEHKDKEKLIAILNNLVGGLAKYQDKTTGLWYQVVDKGDRPDNWLDQSCTGYFVYGIVKAVQSGYINESYLDAAEQAYLGLLTKIYIDDKGKPVILGSADATPPGDYQSYVSRSRKKNYGHGIFAFLLASCAIREYGLSF